MAAPTTPGAFTSPTNGQVVDESIVVSWGESVNLIEVDSETQYFQITSPSAVIVDADSYTLEDDPAGMTVIDNGDGSWEATAYTDDYPIVYRLYREDVSAPTNIAYVDNGDGTWTATSDGVITVDGAGYFEIEDAEPVMIDPDTYVVTDSGGTELYLGSTELTSMVIDTSLWEETTTARFRVEAYDNGEFSGSTYSPYFTIEHPKFFLVGEDAPGAVFVGASPVSAIYVGTTQVF